MNVGDISPALTATAVSAPKLEAASHVPVDGGELSQALHESRLSAVVALIEKMTGREVKLVPPSAYFVSRPAPPVSAPVDVLVRADLTAVSRSSAGPLEVGVHSILRTGTANRMVLTPSAGGGLDLSTAVDVEL